MELSSRQSFQSLEVGVLLRSRCQKTRLRGVRFRLLPECEDGGKMGHVIEEGNDGEMRDDEGTCVVAYIGSTQAYTLDYDGL